MDSDNLKALLAKTLEKATSQARADYLQEVCAGDAALRAELESLLKAHEEAGNFLETPPPELVNVVDGPHLSEGPGAVIDSYKLLELIGEGGMAVVYMAEQDRPLRRRVALKIIKLGMDTKQVIARFDAERQALALMDHPNIAKVFDAGATETGRSYFVMELVRGVSITKYCDKNKLNTAERLKLFAKVCNAVHHAHQKGIIHRDLKPSNIMVTMNDGVPMPKVIDFGIAKATNQRLTEHTVFTRYAEMIGTPEYMSPEQAEMSAMDIDTRTDIYSLGIVLYELLTGTLPFDAETLRKAALGEIQRIIREEEPSRPSTRISSLGQEAEGIAARRCTNVGALTKRLYKELEWIPLKAMRKDRTRRYRSASEFADDIHNYLNDRPLLAGPESPLYRLHKAVHKHRVPVIAASAVTAALIMGLIVSTSLYMRMHRALNAVAQFESQAEIYDSLSTVQRLHAEGRYQDALQEIRTKFDEEDLKPQVALLRAQLLMELGEFAEAESQLNQLTRAEPEIAGAAHSLLALLNITVDPAKAEQHQKLAESMLPQTAEAYYLRGMCAASADDAVRWLSDALRLDSQHYAACKARALAYHSLKRVQKMAEDARVLIALRPKGYLGYALRAIARRETGQFTEALEDHTQAIEFCHLEEELPRLHDQRRQTHMRSGNYQAALEDAQKCGGLIPPFTALLALEEYDQAQAEYRRIARLGTRPARWFKAGAEGHVFKLFSTGQSFDLPADIALKSPFYHMAQAVEFYRGLNEKGRPLSVHGSWLGDWSPDGQAIVYSRYGAFGWLPAISKGTTSRYGRSFMEVLDLKTGETRQITRFGINPVWSPDGKTIAFSEHYGEYQVEADVWVVSSTGGTPRKLAEGTAKAWSRDAKHVYFTTRPFGILYSIAIDLPNADPVPVHGFQRKNLGCSAISPDKRLIAYYISGEIHIQTFPEGRDVARWETPWPLHIIGTQLQWHPKGKTVMLNSTSDHNQMGMCLFDVERAEATHVFNLTRPWCRAIWSPDGSQLIVDPYSGEPRLLEIDPEESLTKVLAPALSTTEFLAQLLEKWDQRIEADPLTGENYVARALVAMGAKDYDQARQDIDHCVTLVKEPNDPAVHALDDWAMRCLLDKRYAEAELWGLGRAQIAEKLPAYSHELAWQGHPYRQLMQVYAAQGEKQKLIAWQKKWLGIHAFAPGSLNYDESTGTYTLTGSGRKIGDTWDEFHFAHKALQGNGSIVVKIDFDEPDRWETMAGVMIRSSLEPDARNATLLMSPGGAVSFQHRKADLQETARNHVGILTEGITLPRWIKLERRGNAFFAHHSPDGVHWEAIKPDASSESTSACIDMNEKVHIGLAVTSHNGPHDAARAIFPQVSITGTVDTEGPFTVSQDIGFSLTGASAAEE